ncbi:MAG: hypothetical protein KAY65_11825 [Planctomycetes bacterium]|nr:hypothetical protein [Planctomycetota bacterium]
MCREIALTFCFFRHGLATGLSTDPAWTAENNQADAYFGFCVSTAGDVNGDGQGCLGGHRVEQPLDAGAYR